MTERCLRDDLSEPEDADIAELEKRHEIVKAFISRRRETPEDTKQVAPLSSNKTVYRLSYGHHHRGCTWHDEENGVVWLLAYAHHANDLGEEDAFPRFKKLDAERALMPTEADYLALFNDRDDRSLTDLRVQAAQLVSDAKADPGAEQRGAVAGHLFAAWIDPNDTDFLVVGFPHAFPGDLIEIVLPAFAPESEPEDWEYQAEPPDFAHRYDGVLYMTLSE